MLSDRRCGIRGLAGHQEMKCVRRCFRDRPGVRSGNRGRAETLRNYRSEFSSGSEPLLAKFYHCFRKLPQLPAFLMENNGNKGERTLWLRSLSAYIIRRSISDGSGENQNL
jgi:hypothetical protein